MESYKGVNNEYSTNKITRYLQTFPNPDFPIQNNS